MEIHSAQIKDIEGIITLINSSNESKVTHDYLLNWYWKNPHNSFSIQILKDTEYVYGISSTNNFTFDFLEKEVKVAFPQKVVTSEKIRGKGYFSKLYWKNEEDNDLNENVDFFLTFTNHVSTPIFLKKLSYLKGQCPDMTYLPPKLFTSKGVTYTKVNNFDTLESSFQVKISNGMKKNKDYFSWRYSNNVGCVGSNYEILLVSKNQKNIGYLILKKTNKKGVPILYLVDYISFNELNISLLLQASRHYAFKMRCVGVMFMNNMQIDKHLNGFFLKLKLKNKLNFLVKGKNEQESQLLAKTTFNFQLGDLDFI